MKLTSEVQLAHSAIEWGKAQRGGKLSVNRGGCGSKSGVTFESRLGGDAENHIEQRQVGERVFHGWLPEEETGLFGISATVPESVDLWKV